MNVALTTEGGRIAPCFAGVEVWIVEPAQNACEHRTIPTAGRDPSFWARDLVRLDVDAFLCAGIDMFLWGVLRGNGIEVFANITGPAGEALERWRAGLLAPLQFWPQAEYRHNRQQARRRHRYRGGDADTKSGDV